MTVKTEITMTIFSLMNIYQNVLISIRNSVTTKNVQIETNFDFSQLATYDGLKVQRKCQNNKKKQSDYMKSKAVIKIIIICM